VTVHILGIDPGASTGLAAFDGGALQFLRTVEPHTIEHMLRSYMPARVVFEDSRLESKVWTTAGRPNHRTVDKTHCRPALRG